MGGLSSTRGKLICSANIPPLYFGPVAIGGEQTEKSLIIYWASQNGTGQQCSLRRSAQFQQVVHLHGPVEEEELVSDLLLRFALLPFGDGHHNPVLQASLDVQTLHHHLLVGIPRLRNRKKYLKTTPPLLVPAATKAFYTSSSTTPPPLLLQISAVVNPPYFHVDWSSLPGGRRGSNFPASRNMVSRRSQRRKSPARPLGKV